jgi:putative heme-binding domain-containing protein
MKTTLPGLIRTSTLWAAALFLCLSHELGQTALLPPSLDLSDPKVIATGETLFAKSCSVGYCHGVAGKAGRGPRLRGREWDKNYLFNVTYEGIPNSSMPAWKGRLSEEEIGSIVAYILTLSKLSSDAAESSSSPSGAPSTVSPPVPITSGEAPARVGLKPAEGLAGDPNNGKSLFFDSSNDLNCAACHRVRGLGNDVGPDLSKIHQRPAREILKDILIPSASLASGRQFVRVVSKSGEQVQGIKVEENSRQLKIYDVESLPPVLRTLAKDQIERLEVQARSAMPAKYGELYTFRQLLDIIAFLKQADSPGSPAVTAGELF